MYQSLWRPPMILKLCINARRQLLLKRDNNRGKIYEVILWQLFVAHLATVE